MSKCAKNLLVSIGLETAVNVMITINERKDGLVFVSDSDNNVGVGKSVNAAIVSYLADKLNTFDTEDN